MHDERYLFLGGPWNRTYRRVRHGDRYHVAVPPKPDTTIPAGVLPARHAPVERVTYSLYTIPVRFTNGNVEHKRVFAVGSGIEAAGMLLDYYASEGIIGATVVLR
jgi:hypothetical protein